MSKIHFQGIKRNAKSHIIDFKLFVQEKHAPFMKVHVHWMNLMKNQIIQKF
jgi:hypothetical protein